MISIKCDNGEAFNNALMQLIDANSGNFKWRYDEDGDYTFSEVKVSYRAWFHPIPDVNGINYGLVGNQKKTMTKDAYAMYHSQFIKMLLEYMDSDFSQISCTSNRSSYDRF